MLNLNGNSRFSIAPTLKHKRSLFPRNYELKTTMNAADIVPIYCEEVYPGDTLKLDLYGLVRMTTNIHPTMDNCYIDTYFFYCPCRLVWDGWKQFYGESSDPWCDETELTVPQLSFNNSGTSKVTVGSLYDYFGIPIGYKGTASALPFRMYNLIYNEYFRNTNLTSKVAVYTGNTEINDFSVLKANKFKDYFTSCLPAPVRTLSGNVMVPDMNSNVFLRDVTGVSPRKQLIVDDSGEALSTYTNLITSDSGELQYTEDGLEDGSTAWLDPNGTLGVDLGLSINALRLAFQTARLFELEARAGNRYRELILGHWSVSTRDSTLQVPEYLGGSRNAVTMSEVYQTTPTATTPLGNLAGVSKTLTGNCKFTKSFTENGFVIGVAVIRPQHTYSFGVPKQFMRVNKLDYYWPSLANIGEMPVRNYEINAVYDSTKNNEVFGYNEAWAELRYSPDRVTGFMHVGVTGTLDSWHYADDFTSGIPKLGDTFIKETPNNIDRTLTVYHSDTVHQFMCDFNFVTDWARILPVFSIPGLIDHN